MLKLVQRGVRGLKRIQQSEYQATDSDPQFIYRFWLRRPAKMSFFLQSMAGDSLDPKIYVDRGSGFDESTALTLRHEGACLYSVSIVPPRWISGVRIDPCSCEGRFRYWITFDWKETKPGSRERTSQESNGIPTYDIVLDGSREKRGRRKWAKNVAAHFDSVVQLGQLALPPIDSGQWQDRPFISFVVPVYNSTVSHLDALLQSFHEQKASGAAELILCDDGSTSRQTIAWLSQRQSVPYVRIIRKEENRGIAAATNGGIALARGEWIGFVDHDDALAPGVVRLLIEAIREHPRCKFIYTDEVVTDEDLKPVSYFFKPAFDEVLLSGVNYINHLSCYRRDRLLAIGGMREGFDGSQDYDLLLRYVRDLGHEEIKHLPYPGYRWRRSRDTFSAKFADVATAKARKALAERYRREGEQTPVIDEAIAKNLHRVRFDTMHRTWPRVSVVIPNLDSFPLISRVIADLTNKTDYSDLEIVVVDNGTTDPRVMDLYAESSRGSIPFKFVIKQGPFNFSHQVNTGIALATGDLILLLNNDIEVIDGGWLREMVSCFDYSTTGIVGARLLYPNRRLQHAGVIVGLAGLAGHWFNGQRESFPGPMARLHVRQTLSAVTGACMLISRSCLAEVGPFDEQEFAVAYNDIDFCLRATSKGFRVVWTPFATLIHHESASRGSDETLANRPRFEREKENLRRRHGTGTFQDRAFSPWYTRDRAEPAEMLLNQIPKAR
jgi:GT2 family glycosyltransferase